MRVILKYIWVILLFFVFGVLCLQIYKTKKTQKRYSELISDFENRDTFELTMVSFYNKFIEKFSLEHNQNISRQSVIEFFTYNNYCYVQEIYCKDDFLMTLMKKKQMSVKYDSALELIDCHYYFLFYKGRFVGTIDIWTPDGDSHLDWYLLNHEVFAYE